MGETYYPKEINFQGMSDEGKDKFIRDSVDRDKERERKALAKENRIAELKGNIKTIKDYQRE